MVRQHLHDLAQLKPVGVHPLSRLVLDHCVCNTVIQCAVTSKISRLATSSYPSGTIQIQGAKKKTQKSGVRQPSWRKKTEAGRGATFGYLPIEVRYCPHLVSAFQKFFEIFREAIQRALPQSTARRLPLFREAFALVRLRFTVALAE
jgi:hypothetical protein